MDPQESWDGRTNSIGDFRFNTQRIGDCGKLRRRQALSNDDMSFGKGYALRSDTFGRIV